MIVALFRAPVAIIDKRAEKGAFDRKSR